MAGSDHGYWRRAKSEMAAMMPMPMPFPENTLPMMTGKGQFGDVNMGGMFTTLKVREGLARNDYKDPGPYQFPKGSVAYEFVGETPDAQRQIVTDDKAALEVQVRKPTGHAGH